MRKTERLKYEERIALLEERVAYVERLNRQCLDSLDIAGKIGYFQSSLNRLPSPNIILSEASEKIGTQIPFESMAFFLVNEASSEFYLAQCSNPEQNAFFEIELEQLIEQSIIPWVMREKRGIIFPARSRSVKLFLHVITTSSRIRGFFMGTLRQGAADVTYIAEKMTSVVLLFCANALESFELYSMVREANRSLKEKIRGRTQELNYRSAFENLIKHLSEMFLDTSKSFCERIQTNQNLLAQFFDAQTCVIYFLQNEHSKFLEKAVSAFPDRDILRRIKPISHENYAKLKNHGFGDYVYFEAETSNTQKLTTLLGQNPFHGVILVPIELMDDFSGILFLGLPKGFENWSEDSETMFKIAGEFFLNAIIREKMIFELGQREEQLRYAQKMDAIGRLAGGISHDFNNILMSISVNAELALMGHSNPDDQERFRQILKATEKGSFITRQLLTMSKKNPEEALTLNVKPIIEELTSVLNRLIGDDIDLEIDLPEEDRTISANQGQLEQVLMNLLVNARDAIRESGDMKGDKTISLSMDFSAMEDAREAVRFRVSDNGCGMSSEVRQNIFEPFFTTKESNKGTGLGLAIVYQILRQNEATISVDSRVGEGTCFTVCWPTTQAEFQPKTTHRTISLSGQDRLLIVEDEPMILNTIGRSLENLGYQVFCANHGRDAVRILEREPIDFVISDINMPEMNGLELMEHIKTHFPDTKVILSTGFFEGIDWEKLESQSIPLIEKPYSILTVVKTLKRLKKNPT